MAPGELLIITGPNGSGKTTLLKKMHSGVSVGYLPQVHNRKFHLPLTLEDVVVLTSGKAPKSFHLSAFGLLRSEHAKLLWNTASGGERQRALLTGMLLAAPRLLLLDEPMNHLDQEGRQSVWEALAKFRSQAKQGDAPSVVMACHQDALEGFDVGVARIVDVREFKQL